MHFLINISFSGFLMYMLSSEHVEHYFFSIGVLDVKNNPNRFVLVRLHLQILGFGTDNIQH